MPQCIDRWLEAIAGISLPVAVTSGLRTHQVLVFNFHMCNMIQSFHADNISNQMQNSRSILHNVSGTMNSFPLFVQDTPCSQSLVQFL
jgi:hypothetical protein